MPRMPHDVSDLALAPVALALDAQLDGFRGLERHEISLRITLETNAEPRDPDSRRAAVLEVLTRFVDLRGWSPSWCDRGIRLEHGLSTVTLGVPSRLLAYVAEG